MIIILVSFLYALWQESVLNITLLQKIEVHANTVYFRFLKSEATK